MWVCVSHACALVPAPRVCLRVHTGLTAISTVDLCGQHGDISAQSEIVDHPSQGWVGGLLAVVTYENSGENFCTYPRLVCNCSRPEILVIRAKSPRGDLHTPRGERAAISTCDIGSNMYNLRLDVKQISR